MPSLNLILAIADPRGRVNRKALLGIALSLIAIQTVAFAVQFLTTSAVIQFTAAVVKLACLWLATSAAIKRLHDLGLTGWWVPAGVLILFVWTLIAAFVSFLVYGDAVGVPGTFEFGVYAAAVMSWPLAVTVWLHYARGEAGANRYGPAPDENGLSHPSDAPTRAVTLDVAQAA